MRASFRSAIPRRCTTWSACPSPAGSKIGSGRAGMRLAPPIVQDPVNAKITLFNGRLQDGDPTIIVYAPDLGPVMTLAGILRVAAERPRLHPRHAGAAESDPAERSRCLHQPLDATTRDLTVRRRGHTIHYIDSPVLCDGTFFMLDGQFTLRATRRSTCWSASPCAAARAAPNGPSRPLNILQGPAPVSEPHPAVPMPGPQLRVAVAVVSDIHSNLPCPGGRALRRGPQRPDQVSVPGRRGQRRHRDTCARLPCSRWWKSASGWEPRPRRERRAGRALLTEISTGATTRWTLKKPMDARLLGGPIAHSASGGCSAFSRASTRDPVGGGALDLPGSRVPGRPAAARMPHGADCPPWRAISRAMEARQSASGRSMAPSLRWPRASGW